MFYFSFLCPIYLFFSLQNPKQTYSNIKKNEKNLWQKHLNSFKITRKKKFDKSSTLQYYSYFPFAYNIQNITNYKLEIKYVGRLFRPTWNIDIASERNSVMNLIGDLDSLIDFSAKWTLNFWHGVTFWIIENDFQVVEIIPESVPPSNLA